MSLLISLLVTLLVHSTRAIELPVVVEKVLGWLRNEWWFKAPVFGSRKGMEGRRKLYAELGMFEVAALWNRDRTRLFHFHAPRNTV